MSEREDKVLPVLLYEKRWCVVVTEKTNTDRKLWMLNIGILIVSMNYDYT